MTSANNLKFLNLNYLQNLKCLSQQRQKCFYVSALCFLCLSNSIYINSNSIHLYVISSVSASIVENIVWHVSTSPTFKPALGLICKLPLLCEFHSSQVQRWDSWNQGYDMMLKFATPQRLGVPSHCLNTLSQRLIERLIKYKELYRNQREKKQSFPKKLFV